MTTNSRTGVLIGATIALVVPIGSLAVASLVSSGIAASESVRPLLDLFGLLTWLSLVVFGPAGIVIAGRSVGLRGASAWIGSLLAALLLFVPLWFLGAATLSGTLGNPF